MEEVEFEVTILQMMHNSTHFHISGLFRINYGLLLDVSHLFDDQMKITIQSNQFLFCDSLSVPSSHVGAFSYNLMQ